LRGENSIAELCRREGINANLYYKWSKDFLEVDQIFNIPPTMLRKKLCKALHKLFRMSKFELQARPIHYQKHDAIKAHVLICFVALLVEKYLELTTKLSLRRIRFLVRNITEIHIQDRITNEIFIFRSPTKDIMDSPLAELILKWKLLFFISFLI
jgi:hypothetical protein